MIEKKEAESIKILKLASEMSAHYYNKPLIICYSGGKDSDVILRLAMKCLHPSEFEVLHSITTVDSPVTNKYVNEIFKELRDKGIECKKGIPMGNDGKPTNMWKLIVEKQIPPTRLTRYCCKTLKEVSTPDRMAVLGVRSDESTKRKGRDVFGVRGGHTSRLHFFHLTTQRRCTMRHLKESKSRMGLCGIAP